MPYLPSDYPIMAQQRADAIKLANCDQAQTQEMRQLSAAGRLRLFNTLINPGSVASELGTGAGVNTAKLQAQTDVSRASGILGAGDYSGAAPSMQEIIGGAPEVVSLNRGAGPCDVRGSGPAPRENADPRPGMPHRAPVIVQGPYGPMYYRGEDATVQGTYEAPTAGGGLTGYSPPWSDALVLPNGGVSTSNDVGVAGWLMANKWLALGIAAAGVLALSRRSRR
jgi:hypothetical protein